MTKLCVVQSWIRIVGKTIACQHQKVENLMPDFLEQRNPASFNLKSVPSEAGGGLSASSHHEASILCRWQDLSKEAGASSLLPRTFVSLGSAFQSLLAEAVNEHYCCLAIRNLYAVLREWYFGVGPCPLPSPGRLRCWIRKECLGKWPLLRSSSSGTFLLSWMFCFPCVLLWKKAHDPTCLE